MPHDRWRAYAWSLAFGTFVVGTGTFVIAGLIPQVTSSLAISTAEAGQLITAFAIGYAVLSPVLAAMTGRWPRRTVLIIGLVLYAAGNLLTALVPGYLPVLATRVLAAAGAALFTPNAGATAALLAGAERRGKAISIVTAGQTISMALGAPIGTAIGQALGWRATMYLITALALLVVPVIALRLPSLTGAPAAGLRARLAPLGDRAIQWQLLVTLLAFIAIFLPYTYISVVFEPVLTGHPSRMAWLLLVFGVTGTVGNLLAGHFADRFGARRVVVASLVGFAFVMVLQLLGRHDMALALVAIAFTGWIAWSFTVPQQHRLLSIAKPGNESLVIALNSAFIYLGVTLSGLFGYVRVGGLPLGVSVLVVGMAFALVTALLAARRDAPRSGERPSGTEITPRAPGAHRLGAVAVPGSGPQ
ncbi:MFS transporter [Pseudonocardiaceae bacterium YIM PH 21723]|nr:MFS transporter [Pseudonocardiaceae bacterium YIM PH 21723]